MAGGMTDCRATEVHDELHVRALALDNNAARIGIAAVDSCAVPRTIIDRAKEIIRNRIGIPGDHLGVSATHTHTAPPAAHLFQSQPDVPLFLLTIGPAYVLHMPGELFVEYQLAAQEMLPGRFVAMAAYGDYGPGYAGTRIATHRAVTRRRQHRARRPMSRTS